VAIAAVCQRAVRVHDTETTLWQALCQHDTSESPSLAPAARRRQHSNQTAHRQLHSCSTRHSQCARHACARSVPCHHQRRLYVTHDHNKHASHAGATSHTQSTYPTNPNRTDPTETCPAREVSTTETAASVRADNSMQSLPRRHLYRTHTSRKARSSLRNFVPPLAPLRRAGSDAVLPGDTTGARGAAVKQRR
jgi:hypothetical protein